MKSSNEQGIAHPALLVVALLAVGLVGFASVRVYQANNKSQLNSSKEVAEDELLPTSLESVLSFEKVKELATKDTDAAITDLKLENKKGTLVYKVDLNNGTQLTLNALTGEVLNSETSDDVPENGEDALPVNFTMGITFDKARQIAQAEYPDSKLAKIQLDVENGVVVLSARFADKARVDIDAATGDIVRTKDPKPAKKGNEDDRSRDDAAGDNSDSNKTERSDDSGRSSSGSDDSKSDSGNSSSETEADDGNEIRVEGTLVYSGGTYKVTQNGTTYTIQSSQNISSLVGQTVRVEGVLQSGNVIKAEKVEDR